MTIDARQYVGSGFPPSEGELLADKLVAMNLPSWNELIVDVSNCPPALLISAFFNAFLQRVFELHPDRLQEARAISWKSRFPFQDKNIKEWIEGFAPYTKNGVLGS